MGSTHSKLTILYHFMGSFYLEYCCDKISTYAKYYEVCAYCAQSLKYHNYSKYHLMYVYPPISRSENSNWATGWLTMLFLASKYYIIGTIYTWTLIDR